MVISATNVILFIDYQKIYILFTFVPYLFSPMKKSALSLLFVLILAVQASPQSLETAVSTITVPEIVEHMKILAGEAMEGRRTGDPGIDKAKEYLLNEFSQLELANPIISGTPFLQEYTLYRIGWQQYFFVQRTDTITSRKDFIVQGNVPEMTGEFEYVFSGYGIEHPKYNNYNRLDVKGKIVIYFIGEPKDKNGNYLITGTKLTAYPRYENQKDSIAFAHGAVSTIRIDPTEETADKMIRSSAVYSHAGMLTLAQTSMKSPGNRNYVYSSIGSTARIMGITKEALVSAFQLLEKGQQKYTPLSGKVYLKAVRYPETVTTANVAALLEGTDLKDEVVVVTAHYDHLGVGSSGIRYGADDNASGTIGILEVAEAFADAAQNGLRPRRSILFLPVSGEEMGLLGSQYYCKHPLVPIDKTFAAINMDMIGRHDDKHSTDQEYVYVYFSGREGEWISEAGKKALSLMNTGLIPEFQFKATSKVSLGGSDHMSFENVGVPVVYFFNGTHPDYHKPTDTWDKIQYDQMCETVRLVFLTTWEIANCDDPKIKK
jgi:hypothetical protein